ncbi:MAG: hypothetical protein AAGD07_25735 [Planctomycetota bacterium]
MSKAFEVVKKENMVKLLSYQEEASCIGSEVRTNSHVERRNRVLRRPKKFLDKRVRQRAMSGTSS